MIDELELKADSEKSLDDPTKTNNKHYSLCDDILENSGVSFRYSSAF